MLNGVNKSIDEQIEILDKILIKNERNNDLVSGNETLESS